MYTYWKRCQTSTIWKENNFKISSLSYLRRKLNEGLHFDLKLLYKIRLCQKMYGYQNITKDGCSVHFWFTNPLRSET